MGRSRKELINGPRVTVCFVLYNVFGAAVGLQFFLPLKCGDPSGSNPCGTERSGDDGSSCTEMNCCFANLTCFKKTPDYNKMAMNYGIMSFMILTFIGACIGCLLYFRRRAKEEKQARHEERQKRKMDRIMGKAMDDHSKRTQR